MIRLALVASLLLGCWSWRTKEDVHRDYADRLTPDLPDEIATPARRKLPTIVLDVYADETYRMQKRSWVRHIRDVVRAASPVLELEFGRRLVVRTTQPWARDGSPVDGVGGLLPALESLRALDPGAPDRWVLGLVGGRPVASPNIHQLGIADVGGRHLVMRTMADLGEHELAEQLDALPAQERDALYRRRRRHREVMVLLHEWGHTMGAGHERDRRWLMSPSYNITANEFSAKSASIIRKALPTRE